MKYQVIIIENDQKQVYFESNDWKEAKETYKAAKLDETLRVYSLIRPDGEIINNQYNEKAYDTRGLEVIRFY